MTDDAGKCKGFAFVEYEQEVGVPCMSVRCELTPCRMLLELL